MALITGLTALLWAAGAAAQEPGYQPTKKPSSGGCRDDESWRYNAGDKGEKGCDHVASEPDKVVKRCVNRKSDDGVWAWNDGTTWNDVPCDFTYPCYCQDVKGGGY